MLLLALSGRSAALQEQSRVVPKSRLAISFSHLKSTWVLEDPSEKWYDTVGSCGDGRAFQAPTQGACPFVDRIS